jgi:uncharacterized protein (TIGR02722 family)
MKGTAVMKTTLLIMMVALLAVGCGGGKKVTRLDTDTVTDLSGQWNDTDARLVAEEMVSDVLTRPWLTNFVEANGHKPVVTVGTIRNMTSEHINTETFTSDFERELINAGTVRFVASHDQRAELREERQEQQEFASPETMKRFREEIGADFALMGAIKTIVDQEGGKRVVFYQTDLELINVETMEKVWVGTKKIKKGIAQGDWKM